MISGARAAKSTPSSRQTRSTSFAVVAEITVAPCHGTERNATPKNSPRSTLTIFVWARARQPQCDDGSNSCRCKCQSCGHRGRIDARRRCSGAQQEEPPKNTRDAQADGGTRRGRGRGVGCAIPVGILRVCHLPNKKPGHQKGPPRLRLCPSGTTNLRVTWPAHHATLARPRHACPPMVLPRAMHPPKAASR